MPPVKQKRSAKKGPSYRSKVEQMADGTASVKYQGNFSNKMGARKLCKSDAGVLQELENVAV